ncbi:TrmB family transcriptional regulator [Candidatus Pacearchaeota archaeon]|nr:TrmB family transcriptional regulator [Candidatus Pacearchaeota archaeon]
MSNQIETLDAKLLGLNNYELSAYKSLIKLGKSSAPEISKISTVPYGRIYDVLYSLEAKGYIKTITGKTKYFIASGPKEIIKLIQDKKKELENLETEFEKLEQIYDTKEDEPVIIVKGNRNFHRIIKEKPEAKKYRYTIKYNSVINPEWIKGYKSKLRKKIDIKNLVRYDEKTKKNVMKWKNVLPEIKAIENEGVVMSLIDDHYVMIGLITSNCTIVIKNEALCKILKKMYLATYEKAEVIK